MFQPQFCFRNLKVLFLPSVTGEHMADLAASLVASASLIYIHTLFVECIAPRMSLTFPLRRK